MIVNQERTQNFSAISAVNVVEDKGQPVLFMNAGVSKDNSISFSEQIRDIDLYKQYRAEVDKDYEEFKKYVIDKVIEE